MKKEKRSRGVKKLGSTVAGVLIKDMEATIFWTGDSRVYIYRSDELLFQTVDHSLVNDLLKVRPLSLEDRRRYAHVVTRSLMGEDGENVEVHKQALQHGDEMIICTDGIYNDCPIEYILDTIRNDKIDIDKHNIDFDDNHSLIYIKV